MLGLAVFLLVISLIMAGFLLSQNAIKQLTRQEKTDSSFVTVANRMAVFLSKNGRLPCPARGGANPASVAYGAETDCAAVTVAPATCGDGYCVSLYNGKRIRTGIVPFKTLGVDKTDAIDAYGNFLTYAVTESQATSAYAFDAGTVHIVEKGDAGTSTFTNTDFTLVSHGPDERGAYNLNGVYLGGCAGPQDDAENCDNDAEFLNERFANAGGGGHFDDRVEFRLMDLVYLWGIAYGDFSTSFYRGFGRIGVGTDTPSQMLDVAGNVRIENGSLYSKEICDSAGTNCFSPHLLGGSAAQGESMTCPPGLTMTDIRNGQPICGGFSGVTGSHDCATDNFFTAISFAAGSAAIEVTCTNALTGASSVAPLN